MTSHHHSDALKNIIASVSGVIVGKRPQIELSVIALASQGHVLVEDVPGVGKTVLARALARSIGCSFSRIQFTPDLLPSDVTGVALFNQRINDFEFRPGPIMAQVVLADEINRATPRAQAALLESMEERQVTVDGATYALPTPFIVLATQNPVEHHGAFPLPESQLDRFMMRLRLGYPVPHEEVRMLEQQRFTHPLEDVEQVVSAKELVGIQRAVQAVHVERSVSQYIVDLAAASRGHDLVAVGVSPRASLAVFRAAQARALLAGRDYVMPDDVKAVAPAVLTHRLMLRPAAGYEERTSESLVRELLTTVEVPGSRLLA